MPMYEYICNNCGYENEIIQKYSEARLSTCPQCNKDTFIRKTSLPSFHLKGGGWYKDGYTVGSGTSKASSKKEATATSPGSASSGG